MFCSILNIQCNTNWILKTPDLFSRMYSDNTYNLWIPDSFLNRSGYSFSSGSLLMGPWTGRSSSSSSLFVSITGLNGKQKMLQHSLISTFHSSFMYVELSSIYFETVAFFHYKLGSDDCPRVDNQTSGETFFI